MTRKEELRKEIEKIWEILTYVKDCYSYSKYIRNPDTLKEKEYIAKSNDFKFMTHAFWRLTIIELAKLFSTNNETHKYNLNKFIDKLKPDGHYRNLKIDPSLVSRWSQKLIENSSSIQIVLQLRNEVYAHTDNYPNLDYANDITYEDVEDLIDVISDIVKTIYSVLFNSDALIRPISYRENSFNMIKILAEEKETRIKNKIDKLLGNVK